MFSNKEYFTCKQFDEIARIMKVELRNRDRYEFQNDFKEKASLRSSYMIIFDIQWFTSLSPKARCAVLAHELWHVKTRNRSILYFIISLLTSLLLVFGAWGLVFWTLIQQNLIQQNYLLIIGLMLFTVVLWGIGFNLLTKRIDLIFEFPSDQASVNYFGVEATREYLATLISRRQFWLVADHPQIEERLKRIEEHGKLMEKPEIDFDELERDIPQVFKFQNEGKNI